MGPAPGDFPQAINNLLDYVPALQIRQKGMKFQRFWLRLRVQRVPPPALNNSSEAVGEEAPTESLAVPCLDPGLQPPAISMLSMPGTW